MQNYVQITDNDDTFINNNNTNNTNLPDLHELVIENSNIDIQPKFYELFIYIDHESSQLKHLYLNAAHKHNQIVDNYLNALIKNEEKMESYCFNAGFDLFCHQDTESIGAQKVILNHKIISFMKIKNIYVSYYLYSQEVVSVVQKRITPFLIQKKLFTVH